MLLVADGPDGISEMCHPALSAFWGPHSRPEAVDIFLLQTMAVTLEEGCPPLGGKCIFGAMAVPPRSLACPMRKQKGVLGVRGDITIGITWEPLQFVQLSKPLTTHDR